MKRFLIILVVALFATGIVAQSLPQLPKVTKFDWSQFSFDYTEDGVAKNANLTDAAKTTDHIIALLRAVYINKYVPGIHYAYAYQSPDAQEPSLHRLLNYGFNYTSHKDYYEGSLASNHKGGGGEYNTWDHSLDTDILPIENPVEDGMTVLLVQLNESWTTPTGPGDKDDAYEIIDQAFNSVQVVEAFTRVHDENNPGYLFAINGTATNKFFFISKGKPRGCSSSPLYRLYEQISPVKGDHAVTTYDFISKMKSGQPYYCLHDCYDVTTYDRDRDHGKSVAHWFTISNEGEAYSLKNLCLYMPDRRFENELRNQDPEVDGLSWYDDGAKFYTNYGVKDGNSENDSIIRPKVLMYTADLNAEAVPSEVANHYRVNLDWSTSFTDKKIGAHVPEHFYVYMVKDDGSWVRIDDLLEKHEPVTEHAGSYLVEQNEYTQIFHYVITAHPINYDMDGNMIVDGKDTVNVDDDKPYITITAVSPVRQVVIPPIGTPFFQRLVEYRSYYDVASEQNYYRNTISIFPANESSLSHLSTFDGKFGLVRHYPDENNPDSVKEVKIADVTFTRTEDGTGLSYKVDYVNDTQDETFIGLFGDNSVPTEGTVESMDDDIRIIDRFPALTQRNDHYDHYEYSFVEVTHNALNSEVLYNCSNPITVPVHKTSSNVEQMQYTLDDVYSDADHHLDAKPCNVVTFEATYDPTDNVVEYDALRFYSNKEYFDDDEIVGASLEGEFKVGKAENFDNSGRYDIFTVDQNGALNVLNESLDIQVGEHSDISLMDQNAAIAATRSFYVPVIISLYGGNQNKVNTYGCDIKPMAYPTLDLSILSTLKTKPYNVQDPNGGTAKRMSYTAVLNLSPTLPAEIKNAYYYRIWRVIEGETVLDTETLLNSLPDQSGTSYTGAQWTTYYWPLKTVYPGNNDLNVIDLFVDEPYVDNKKVTYIARLYATDLDDTSDSSGDIVIDPIRRVSGNESRDYVVAEDVVEVYFNDGTITGVDDIDADEVDSVTYYNLQGIPSNTPYQGINIIRVLYKNGKIETRKEIQ